MTVARIVGASPFPPPPQTKVIVGELAAMFSSATLKLSVTVALSTVASARVSTAGEIA